MPKILIINGPNLNLLGSREPEIYGRETLNDIYAALKKRFPDVKFETYQSNSEGALIDRLQQARGKVDGVVFNPGGYTHTSIALLDAIKAVELPVIEIHLSLPEAREDFRHHSYITPACRGRIAGLGSMGYQLAVEALISEI
ncbi:type II 3-dehydroquinate dehydratase [candidate division LCP-89 bacterium B3_LCP]|uniref:3-dehydroquinate dehydratase n=1 Tax=candidate division LCP-89 bacterium B3_LCP TaxID=2012998 RepID=A0A532UVX1_UNCL8|nr:MAG: type II 3-dehydroquinate dehydratase [candidate division LCP-89 bacterium B3_LCP]